MARDGKNGNHRTKGSATKPIRVGVYVRQSVADDKEFSSLEAQSQAIRSYIDSQRSQGWEAVPDDFIDRGYSGANVERPAYRHLLEKIEEGTVDVVPVYKNADGDWIANPFVVTDRFTDELGRIVYGDWKSGAERAAAKGVVAGCTVDLSGLDQVVDALATRLMHTFPDCTRKSLESLRKKKLEHWYANSETNRSWLSLNMNVEAAAGFPAFHFGDRGEREIDFIEYRKRIAAGARFDQDLVKAVLPPSAVKKMFGDE